MINDIILFAKLTETNLATYGNRLKGLCEGSKINTVIELLRLYRTNLIADTIPFCGLTLKEAFETFCADLLAMSEEEQQQMAAQIQKFRATNPPKKTYIIPRKISDWIEELFHGYVQEYPSERIREKFMLIYPTADRFYDALLFKPDKAFFADIDPDLDVVKEVWRLTVSIALFLTENVCANKQIKKTDSFRRKSEEFVENLQICHIESINRLNFQQMGVCGQILVIDSYMQHVKALKRRVREELSTPKSMERIIFGHPEMVWRTFDTLSLDTQKALRDDFEDLYTLIAQLANQLPEENHKLYLNQMFGFLEPYQEGRVLEYIQAHDNIPILYLILAYIRSRPTSSYMDVLSRFNGFFGPEQTVELISSSLGTRRNKIVNILKHPESDQILSRIASYPQAQRYNLSERDWIDLTDAKTLMDNDERTLVEKLNATDEALYYALSTLNQIVLVPILDRMIGIAPDLYGQIDFAGAITSLWKLKFQNRETPKSISFTEIFQMHSYSYSNEVSEKERVEKVLVDLVGLFMPDVQIEYPNLILPESQINAEAELLRYINIMKEITLENLHDIFNSNYPQCNIRRPKALIPIIESSQSIGYNPRKRKLMPEGPKTVKFPTDHIKDASIEDRPWLSFQGQNGIAEEPLKMPSQGIKGLKYDQVARLPFEEETPTAIPIIQDTSDIKSVLKAALEMSVKLAEVDTSEDYREVSFEDEINASNAERDVKPDRTVVFETETSLPKANATGAADNTISPSNLENPLGWEGHSDQDEATQEKEPQTNANAQPHIADILEDFDSHSQPEQQTQETSVEAEAPVKTEEENLQDNAGQSQNVEIDKIKEVISTELIEEVQAPIENSEGLGEEQKMEEGIKEPLSRPEKELPQTEKELPQTEKEFQDNNIPEQRHEVEKAQETIVEEVSQSSGESHQMLKETEDENRVEAKVESSEEKEVEALVEEPQTLPVKLTQTQELSSEKVDEPKEEIPLENPILAAKTSTATAAPTPVSIVTEDSKSKPATALSSTGKSNKNTKDIVVVNESQAEMSPYRQSKVLEDKKSEEEKKEKEKPVRKPILQPEPSLPLKENILRLLRTSKSPMTLANIAKALRKAGIDTIEDEVGDIIYKFDKDLFLFFTMNFIGLMEKKYNFSMYRLDPKNSQTFDYMGRAFFDFCDSHGRMPFMDNEEEKFLDRWVSQLLDEKVKHTPQQMKWFKLEVIKRRGKVLNKEEWKFVEKCHEYRKFFDEHKSHPNIVTEPRLCRWFARASQSYNTLNTIKRVEFDSLVEYLDQFGLFGILD